MLKDVLALMGIGLTMGGIAVIYWPLAIIVAGLSILGVGCYLAWKESQS